MSEAGRDKQGTKGKRGWLALSWQAPLLALAVAAWGAYLLTGRGGEQAKETKTAPVVEKAGGAEQAPTAKMNARQMAANSFSTGEVEEGVGIIEKALAETKDSETRTGLMLTMARGLRSNGAAGRAEDALRKAIAENPKSALAGEMQLDLGLVLKDGHKNAEARKVFLGLGGMDGARFLAADCSLAQGKTAEAEKEFEELAKGPAGSDETTAAQMRLAKIYLESARWDEARSKLSRLRGSLGDKTKLANRYAQDSELRSMWNEVLGHYVESEPAAFEREAEALKTKAEQAEAQGLVQEAKNLREEGRNLKLKAAKAYLAVVNGTEKVRSDGFEKALWGAADCLYEGGDYARAAVYYRMCHREARSDEKRTMARMQYGRAMAALGVHKEAIENFESVMTEYPGTMAAWEAEFAAGMSHAALGEFKEARKAFETIVKNEEQLTPKAEVWKQSLAMLGYACYAAGDYDEAATRLEQASARGLGKPGTTGGADMVEFLLAESLRLAKAGTVAERQEKLGRAAGLYEKVIGYGQGQGGQDAWPEMTRNARLARAGCLFEMGRYEEATKAYREYSELYARSEGAVTALYRLATCCERLGRASEAKDARELAKWTAGNIKPAGGKKETVLADYWRTMQNFNALQEAGSMASRKGTSHE